jgi:hypothetical protein
VSRSSEVNGKGYLSVQVIALSHQKSTHSWRDLSFFLIKRTGALNGEFKGQMNPVLRFSSINFQSLQLKFREQINGTHWNFCSFVNVDFQIAIPMRWKSIGFLPGKDISKFMVYTSGTSFKSGLNFGLSGGSGLRGS